MTQEELNVQINTQANLAGITETNAALGGLGSQLQTATSYTSNFGGALTAQEASYATSQLASKELSTATRDLGSEASAAARGLSTLGAEGAAATDRFLALGATMSSGGLLGIGMMALLVGLTAAIGGTKSLIDNTEALSSSSLGLDQALQTQGSSLADNVGWINQWLTANAAYIQNQYQARDAIAAVIRAGYDQADTQRMMTSALDLAAAKHVDFSTALAAENLAVQGNTKGLRDLGFSASDLKDIFADGANIGKVNALLDALDPKIAGAAANTSALTQSGRVMATSWQNLTDTGGPLVDELAKIELGVAKVVDWINRAVTAVGGFKAILDSVPGSQLLQVLAAMGGGGSSGPTAPTGGSASFGASTGSSAPAGNFAPASASTGPNYGPAQYNAPGQASITINNYGISDPTAAGFVTAQQLQQALSP